MAHISATFELSIMNAPKPLFPLLAFGHIDKFVFWIPVRQEISKGSYRYSLSLVNIFTKVNSKYIYWGTLNLLYLSGKVGLPMSTFLGRLRALREDNDLTQAQVAQMLGTSQTMYARYERGANELPLRHLIVLCRIYNVSADFLLDIVPDKSRKRGVASLGNDHTKKAEKK